MISWVRCHLAEVSKSAKVFVRFNNYNDYVYAGDLD